MLPELFRIGSFSIPTFGLMVLLGAGLGLWLAMKRAPRFGLTKDQISDVALWGLALGIVGARIGYILQNLSYYSAHPNELIQLQMKGMTSFGGLVLGAVPFFVFSKKWRISPIAILDCVAPSLLLAHAVGRFGCLFNGCCYGGRSELPWAVAVSDHSGGFLTGRYHPAQIYDAALTAVFLALLLIVEKPSWKRGMAIGFAFFGYSAARFITEFWRVGSTGNPFLGFQLSEAQVASIVLAIIGLGFFFLRPRREEPDVGSAPGVAAS